MMSPSFFFANLRTPLTGAKDDSLPSSVMEATSTASTTSATESFVRVMSQAEHDVLPPATAAGNADARPVFIQSSTDAVDATLARSLMVSMIQTQITGDQESTPATSSLASGAETKLVSTEAESPTPPSTLKSGVAHVSSGRLARNAPSAARTTPVNSIQKETEETAAKPVKGRSHSQIKGSENSTPTQTPGGNLRKTANAPGATRSTSAGQKSSSQAAVKTSATPTGQSAVSKLGAEAEFIVMPQAHQETALPIPAIAKDFQQPESDQEGSSHSAPQEQMQDKTPQESSTTATPTVRVSTDLPKPILMASSSAAEAAASLAPTVANAFPRAIRTTSEFYGGSPRQSVQPAQSATAAASKAIDVLPVATARIVQTGESLSKEASRSGSAQARVTASDLPVSQAEAASGKPLQQPVAPAVMSAMQPAQREVVEMGRTPTPTAISDLPPNVPTSVSAASQSSSDELAAGSAPKVLTGFRQVEDLENAAVPASSIPASASPKSNPKTSASAQAADAEEPDDSTVEAVVMPEMKTSPAEFRVRTAAQRVDFGHATAQASAPKSSTSTTTSGAIPAVANKSTNGETVSGNRPAPTAQDTPSTQSPNGQNVPAHSLSKAATSAAEKSTLGNNGLSGKNANSTPVESAASLAQTAVGPVGAALQAEAVVTPQNDGTQGANSSQRMKFVAKKNEIAASTEQKVPTATQVGDVSGKAAPISTIDPDAGRSSRREDTFAVSMVANVPSKVSDLNAGAAKATSNAPVIDTSAAQAERLGNLLNQQVMMVRQSGAHDLSVSLKLDPQTELNLQLTNHNGQIEAYVSWERGSVAGLGNHWQDLQESLAKQNIQLLPLENKSAPRAGDSDSGSNGSSNFSDEAASRNSQRNSGEAWQNSQSAAVKTASPKQKATAKTGSRQGWESWA